MKRLDRRFFRSALLVVSCVLAVAALLINFVPALEAFEYLRMPSMIFCFSAVLLMKAIEPSPRAR